MSIVPYGFALDSNDTNDDNQRSIVLSNSQHKSVVLYNKETNSFQIVNHDAFSKSSRKEEDDDDSDDQEGAKNKEQHHSKSPHRNRNNKRSRTRDRQSTPDGHSNIYICPNCGYTDIHADNKSTVGENNSDHYKLDEFIRSDYFKILASSEYGNKDQEKILKIFKNSKLDSSITESDSVPRKVLSYGNEGKTFTPALSWINEGSNGKEDAEGNLEQLENSGKKERDNLVYNKESSISSDELENLPPNLFTQGYFKKFFKELKVLGNGSNGKVLKVEHVLHDLPLGIFALKKIAIGNSLSNLENILQEVKLLYQLTESTTTSILNSEPISLDPHLSRRNSAASTSFESGKNNLVKYNHVWLEFGKVSDHGPNVPCVFILLEYCAGGTLDELMEELISPKLDINEEREFRRMIKKQKRLLLNEGEANFKDVSVDIKRQPNIRRKSKRYLNNFEIYKFFRDILNGVSYLHKLHILHRDLKPSNCLLKQEFVTDLKFYRPIQSIHEIDKLPTVLVSDFGEGVMEGKKRKSTGATGTLEFLAPELFDTKVEFTNKSDIYSLGLILYYLCYGKLPYTSHKPDLIRQESLEHSCFKDIYSLREHTENDPFLKNWVDLILWMTDVVVYKRPDCDELMEKMDEILMLLSQTEETSKQMGSSDELTPTQNPDYSNTNLGSKDSTTITTALKDHNKNITGLNGTIVDNSKEGSCQTMTTNDVIFMLIGEIMGVYEVSSLNRIQITETLTGNNYNHYFEYLKYLVVFLMGAMVFSDSKYRKSILFSEFIISIVIILVSSIY